MEIQNIEIGANVDEDTVQFVKHLEENLDPNDEHDSEVWIETVAFDEINSLPGDDIPTRGEAPERAEFGVYVYNEFEDNSDAISKRLSTAARSFYGQSNEYTLNSSFDGGKGEFEAYVFRIVN